MIRIHVANRAVRASKIVVFLTCAACNGRSNTEPKPVLDPAPPDPAVLSFHEPMTRPTPLPADAIAYTPEALAAGVSGTMVVRCVITTAGSLRNCRVLQSVPLMDETVVAALYRHRSVPVTYKGRPVNAEYTFNIRFKMPAVPRPVGSDVPIPGADIIIASLRPRFRRCYEEGLVQAPAMRGSLVFVVLVDKDGRVSEVKFRLREGDLIEAVAACVQSVIQSVAFPKPSGGHAARLEVPLTLVPDIADVPAVRRP